MGQTSFGSDYRKDRYFNEYEQSGRGSSTPTFNSPEAQTLLRALSGFASSGSGVGDLNTAGKIFRDQAGGQINPYVEEAIRRSNDEATKVHNTGLASLRAGGYRGGTAANLFGQNKFSNDFAAALQANNAATRVGAFDSAQDRSLSAAGGLSSQGLAQQGLAAQILSLLRGEDNTQNVTGQSSGKKSSTGHNIQQSFSYI